MEVRGFELHWPLPTTLCKTTTKPIQGLVKSDAHKNHTCFEQENNKLLHKKCAKCVHQDLRLSESDFPTELLELISVWPKLPKHIKSPIKTLIQAGRTNKKK